jgi:quercetin dioxygenase-like cupin family protein
MPTLITMPSIITAAGNKPKKKEKFVGRRNTYTEKLSIARMTSPEGWIEPGQKPEFDEYTIVIKGFLRVRTDDGIIDVPEGQAIIAHAGEWVQYSAPEPDGAEYISICLPAFAPNLVHRDIE